MPKEYELRFKNFNKANIINKLKELGATKIHDPIIYEYTVFIHPNKIQNTYIRIRKEFNNITLTYKNNTDDKFADEYEVNVSDYNETMKIFEMLGIKKAYSIQKLREKWEISGCKEIVFDTYPGIPEYMEIECNNEKKLNSLIKKLGLKEEKPFGVKSILYDLYGIESKKNSSNDYNFDTVIKIFLHNIKKNKNIFKKIVKAQQKYISTLI